MATREKKPSSKGGRTVLDAERTAEVTPLAGTSAAAAGSALGGGLVEGTFLPTEKVTFVESPFGDRYVSTKPKSLLHHDVAARLSVWAFSCKGYCDIGTFTATDVPGVTDGYQLLQDWYPHVRDMAKRSLKYKHVPTTMTHADLLMHYLDVYHYALANLTSLMNLNRIGLFNAGLNVLVEFLPRYMSRIIRAWKRLSASKAPRWLKAHAIRDGLVIYKPHELAPTLRFWCPMFLLAATEGPDLTTQAYGPGDMLQSADYLGVFVTNLEKAIRWLEVGGTTGLDDFIAMKDLIDMASDVVPGSFEQGLPKSEDLPGLCWESSVFNEYFRRAYFSKDIHTAATDRWTIFPIPSDPNLSTRIPVFGKGTPSVYDFTNLGAPKYGHFETSVATGTVDVNSDTRIPGTDFWVGNALDRTGIEDIFGSDSVYRESIIDHYGNIENQLDAGDFNTAATIRAFAVTDAMRELHPWCHSRYWDRQSYPDGRLRCIEESDFDYLFWADPEDYGWNYSTYLALGFGIPYIKGGA